MSGMGGDTTTSGLLRLLQYQAPDSHSVYAIQEYLYGSKLDL